MLVSIFYEDRQQRNRKKKRTGWKGRGLGAKWTYDIWSTFIGKDISRENTAPKIYVQSAQSGDTITLLEKDKGLLKRITK